MINNFESKAGSESDPIFVTDEEIEKIVSQSSGDLAAAVFDEDDDGYRIIFKERNHALNFCKGVANIVHNLAISQDEVEKLVESDNSVFIEQPNEDEWDAIVYQLLAIKDANKAAPIKNENTLLASDNEDEEKEDAIYVTDEEIEKVVSQTSGDLATAVFDEENDGYKIIFKNRQDAINFCKGVAKSIDVNGISEIEAAALVGADNSVFIDQPNETEWDTIVEQLLDIKMNSDYLGIVDDIEEDDDLDIFDEEFDDEDDFDDIEDNRVSETFAQSSDFSAQITAIKEVVKKVSTLNNKNFSEELKQDLLRYTIKSYQGGFHALNAPTIFLSDIIERNYPFALNAFRKIMEENQIILTR